VKNILACAVLLFASIASFNASAGGNVESGKALTQKYACASCHGADYNTPTLPDAPKLAGQYQDYLEKALVQYRRGKSDNGRANAMMMPQVMRQEGDKTVPLTDKEIKDIAAYLASLPGSLVSHK
jgi:cytochrome c553